MHRQRSCVSFVIRQEGGTVKTDSDMDAHGWQRPRRLVEIDLRPADAANFLAPCAGQYEQLDAFAVLVPVPPERDQTQGAKACEGHGYPESGQIARHWDWHGPAHCKRA